MTTFYVATLAKYVLVEADGPDEARQRGEQLLGAEARTVRPATTDEIALQRWCNNKIREEEQP